MGSREFLCFLQDTKEKGGSNNASTQLRDLEEYWKVQQIPPIYWMEKKNHTVKFMLLGFSDFQQESVSLFLFFFTVYTLSLMANIVIIIVIQQDSRLSSPMYFFLANLSFIDICFSTVTVPRMLSDLLTKKRVISSLACFSQMYFSVAVGITEIFIITVMAYDRQVAICNPLRYHQVMNRSARIGLIAGSWVIAWCHSLLHTIPISRMPYCGDNHIHHFFCDIAAILKIACGDKSENELVIFTEGTMVIVVPSLFVVVSYIRIISSIIKLRSVEGQRRAFSTCSSHLTVVFLFFGTVIFIYFRPTSRYALNYDRILSVIYTVITPLLNPIIYCLQNKEVKGAIRALIQRKTFSPKN
ncbi:olfactory receptor 5F1-like [Pleurodeles waltl]|uniref:olfactory receptor 5F1-like n=1 Tax=Pleurodeles waltl TaxID=8319 RepID=UPI0037093D44